MDGPFGALDEQTRVALQGELPRLREETGTAVLLATHSVDEAPALGDRVVVLPAPPGRILREVPAPLPRPPHPWKARG